MKMTRQRVGQIAARLDEYQETALRNTGKGSYGVRLRDDITTHMDFSDLALLGAARQKTQTQSKPQQDLVIQGGLRPE